MYAALKTGFRAVVAWETEEEVIGSLRWSIDAGSTTVATERFARTKHVFVIDSLPIGRSFCFTPLAGSTAIAAPKAMRLANAMNAFEDGAYTTNMLVLANEQPQVGAVEGGLDEFATIVWDMTDGHARIGRVVTVFGDLEHPNGGYVECFVGLRPSPPCHHYYDVLFTSDAHPQGAASTTLDAIQSRFGTIWMNSYHQAGLVNTGDNVGLVLSHEFGHYAFGLLDLYTGGPDCWDPVLQLSVMGGNRGANELDDATNRCPNEANIGNYQPSWPRLRQRFPNVPDRVTIDAGPLGDGGKYARTSIDVTPQITRTQAPPIGPLSVPIVADDAGSGRDAGNHIVSATPIETGRVYQGFLLAPLDGADVYVFDAPGGSTVEARAYPRNACFEVMDGDGDRLGSSCQIAPDSVSRTLTAPGGPLYLRFSITSGVAYRFGVGVDEPAPGPLDG